MSVPPLEYRIKHLHERQWLHNSCYFAPFYPQPTQFHGTPLESLSYVPRDKMNMIPNEESCFRCVHAESWAGLEERFLTAIAWLEKWISTMAFLPQTFMVRFLRPFDPPSSFSYMEWTSETLARDNAFAARRALVLLATKLAFLVAMVNDTASNPDAWSTILETYNYGPRLDPAFVDVLSKSWVVRNDRSLPRIGFYWYPGSLLPDCSFRFFINANVPIYIYWGDAQTLLLKLPRELSADLRPTPEQARSAIDLTGHPLSPAPRPRRSRTTAASTSTSVPGSFPSQDEPWIPSTGLPAPSSSNWGTPGNWADPSPGWGSSDWHSQDWGMSTWGTASPPRPSTPYQPVPRMEPSLTEYGIVPAVRPPHIFGNTQVLDAQRNHEKKRYHAGEVIPSLRWEEGQDFRTFHIRRRDYHNYYINHLENPRLRQSRLSREANAARYPLPSQGGTAVIFEWQDGIRQRVPEWNRETIWNDLRNPWKKKYDSVLDEWDLSYDFVTHGSYWKKKEEEEKRDPYACMDEDEDYVSAYGDEDDNPDELVPTPLYRDIDFNPPLPPGEPEPMRVPSLSEPAPASASTSRPMPTPPSPSAPALTPSSSAPAPPPSSSVSSLPLSAVSSSSSQVPSLLSTASPASSSAPPPTSPTQSSAFPLRSTTPSTSTLSGPSFGTVSGASTSSWVPVSVSPDASLVNTTPRGTTPTASLSSDVDPMDIDAPGPPSLTPAPSDVDPVDIDGTTNAQDDGAVFVPNRRRPDPMFLDDMTFPVRHPLRLLREHFGLLPLPGTAFPVNTTNLQVDTLYHAYKVLGYFLPGDREEHLDAGISAQTANEVLGFIGSLILGSKMSAPANSALFPPPPSWLYRLESSHILQMRLTNNWRCVPVQNGWALRSLGIEDRCVVYLQDPAFVLEIITSAMQAVEDVAVWLLQMGVPFNLLDRRKRPSSRKIVIHSPVRVIRDFQSYVDDLSDYLSCRDHRKVLRAAFLAGGIIWRIVQHMYDESVALGPPSDRAHHDNIGLHIVVDNVEYVDDLLTADEINLIIGKHSSGTASWWPSPDTWNGSSIGRGWWSENAEDFFQRRLLDCRDPRRSQVLRNSVWKDVLKADRRVKPVLNALKIHAEKALEAVL
ncbi:hypothetical protein PUNSTDRAFT_133529 [Punctularia strigosozonata HHB-11173 SS5]|uniref:uncharacterized protein n=1 Tax=Punctularia strigosozonata (strain HHB-11173) TaxID=741275 RepID=UPI0004416939|nr:uncharacterized protein PUNSTDRAFT_133529 [Punctularia strigosozonata HHB-11173 SS5]EIN09761.1 hypothetical protein PUNSTDRAFT_133529 [Punctularia strigosozonata HHB-11173 SS5]